MSLTRQEQSELLRLLEKQKETDLNEQCSSQQENELFEFKFTNVVLKLPRPQPINSFLENGLTVEQIFDILYSQKKAYKIGMLTNHTTSDTSPNLKYLETSKTNLTLNPLEKQS